MPVAAMAVTLTVILAVVIWATMTHHRLASLAKTRDQAWGGVLAQLKRKHDLVPGLLELARGHMAQENMLLEKLAALRPFGYSNDPRELGTAEQEFSSVLIRVMAAAERYPAIRTDRRFHEVQNSLVAIESTVQIARRNYNWRVCEYNARVSAFSGKLLARRFGFAESPFFDLEAPAEADMPTVSYNAGVVE